MITAEIGAQAFSCHMPSFCAWIRREPILLASNLTVHRHWAGALARVMFFCRTGKAVHVLAVISSAGVAVQTDNRMFVSRWERNEGTPH